MFLALSAPVTTQWELTDWCNLLCVHCYNYWRAGKRRGKVTITPQFHATSQRVVSELVKNGVFSVTITGGEPLVVLNDVYPYLELLRDNGIQINVNSNLTLMTDKVAQKLRRLGIRGVLTSLMTDDPSLNDQLACTPGAHKRTVRGIKIAQEHGFKVFVNMVVTKKNLKRVFPTASFVASLGVTNFSATKAATPGNAFDFSEYRLSREEFHEMLRELVRARDELGLSIDSLEFYPACAFPNAELAKPFSHRRCTAGRTMCTIGSNGEIRPCSHAPMNYGNINEGLKVVWERLSSWRTDEFLPDECRDCPLRFTCGGGCKTEAYITNGSLKSLDPYGSGIPVIVQYSMETRDFPAQAIFTVNPLVRMRPESFGGILFRRSRSWIPVTRDLFRLVKLYRQTGFTAQYLAETLGTSIEEVLPTLTLLVNKDIILANGS